MNLKKIEQKLPKTSPTAKINIEISSEKDSL